MKAKHNRYLSCHLISLFISIAFLFSTPIRSYGFTSINARAISLGGNEGAIPKGVAVVGNNPAYLAFQDSPDYSFYLPLLNYSMRLGNDALSFSSLTDYFQEDKLLTEKDKDDLLGFIEKEALNTGLDMYLPLLGIGFPYKKMKWIVSVDVITMTDMNIDKDLISMVFKGHGLDRFGSKRVIDNLDLKSHLFCKTGLTGAGSFGNYRLLDEICAGFTLSFLYGGVYGKVEDASMTLFMDHDSLNADAYANVISGYSGLGYSLDLGGSVKMFTRRMIVGLSLINIVNQISYSNGERRLYGFNIEKAPPLNEMEEIEDWIDENAERVDSLEEKVSVSTNLPVSILLSGGFWLYEDLLLTGSLRQGLNNVVGSTTVPRLTAGLEYKPHPAIPLRAGVGFGGREGFTVGTGVGFRKGVWHTDIGFAFEEGLIHSSKGFSFGINMAYFFEAGETDPFKMREYWLKKAKKQMKQRTAE
ncbi:MAG: hypothetical protein HQ568_00020 [Calditrichaeota bacterium]|nr:hypothetical protein [Calditrichota bacterium]